ncbi:MAG: hypothetical protein ACTSYD_05180 [Candidatus Heimdallarchaeaceae archaeon]
MYPLKGAELNMLKIIVMVPVILLACCISHRKSENGYNVVLYKSGIKLKTHDNTNQLLSYIESTIIDPDDIYELIVTDDLIDQIKRNESAIEIVYGRKRQFTINKVDKISIKRILIPLSGRFAENGAIVFFCGFPEYSSGPYVKKGKIKQLLQEINALKWE